METTAVDQPEGPRYPTVHFDGKIFAGLGNMGDEVTIVVKGKITSTREDEFGSCIGVEVYSAGASEEDLKSAGINVANEADKSLAKLAPSLY